jgi:hypothetical protein
MGQIFVKQRATETGDITFATPATDVSGMPLLTHELVVYALAGATPDVTVTVETSSDMLTWTPVGTPLNVTGTPDTDLASTRASQNPYSRYIRYEIVISGSVTSVEYSLVLNTFPSS